MFHQFFLLLQTKLWSFGRATFYRDLADAIQRKVGLRDFLEREIKNAAMSNDYTKSSVMRALSSRLASGDGSKLSQLFVGVVPASDLMLLASVDDAIKDRHLALERVADAVDFQLRSLKTLAMNMFQPLVAIPVVGYLCVLTSDIIGAIAKSAPPSIWVGFNAFVRSLAEFIEGFWMQGFVLLFASVVALVLLLPNWRGSLRLKIDDLPGFSLYRDYNAAIVLSAMSMMISSGKTINQAVEDMSGHARPWLRWHLRRILLSIEDNPNDYVAAFSHGLMSKKIRARLSSLLDSAKSFDQALISLGTNEVARLERSVKLSAQSLSVGVMGVLILVAVVLSLGQMTITSAMNKAVQANTLR